jgi:hypothetical protein
MIRVAFAGLLITILTWSAQAKDLTKDRVIESKVVGIDLFKNGLGVITREVKVPGGGDFSIEDVPEPVHGTFWLESDAKITARITTRKVAVPAHLAPLADLQHRLAGREVTIFFRDARIPPVSGSVAKVSVTEDQRNWNRRYLSNPNSYWNRIQSANGSAVPTPRMLLVDSKEGRAYIDLSMIGFVQSKGGADAEKEPQAGSATRRLPVLKLKVESDKATTIRIQYLSKGMAWAPSYRVNISDPKLLSIEQKAVIKNELEDIKDVPIRLISGFPSVQFGHVTSPFSLSTNWSQFFSQVNQQGQAGGSLGQQRQMVMYQNSVSPNAGIDLAAIPTGEGVDLHYQSIGKHELSEGDALMTSVATAKGPYERIIEWIVPDTRRANGRYIDEYQRRQAPGKYQDAAWDAVEFKNPFKFPMTTAPAMIVGTKGFSGQRLSYWVNPGEQTTLHITKALSIRTRSTELEEKGERQIVYIGGNDYRQAKVKGQLHVCNKRKETVKLVIRRRFSGELISADASPKSKLLEEGVYSANPRNELNWTLTLKPGQEKTLNYRYSVLVDH